MMRLSENFNKYKSIVYSVILFIIVDLFVLVFSFFISFKIDEDAVAINLAGGQRSLSQEITKYILEFERAYNKGEDYQEVVSALDQAVLRFDQILIAFDLGGNVNINGRLIDVDTVDNVVGRDAIEIAKPMWEIYRNYTKDVLDEFKENNSKEDVSTIFFRESILKDIALYAIHNNTDLLEVMDSLTVSLEQESERKTQQLRIFQGIAIFIAVVNFIIILFFSLQRILRSDSQLEAAKAEIDVMFNTISEGIFLLDRRLNISDQYSKGMETIFNAKHLSGRSFLSFLEDYCADFNKKGVNDFLSALFDSNKKIEVLNVLNPLQSTLVHIKRSDSVFDDKKYLRFSCSRILVDGEIDNILVRVADISSEVIHDQLVEEQRKKEFKQLRLMSAIMNSNVDVLPLFFQKSFHCFDTMGGVLQSPVKNSQELSQKIDRLDTLLSDFRQEVEALNFESLIDITQDFKSELIKLREKPSLSVDDFSQLSVALSQLSSHTESIYKFSNKILAEASLKYAGSNGDDRYSDHHWSHLDRFVEKVSRGANKQVELLTSGLNDNILDKSFLTLLNSLVVSVVYHSITDSIEESKKREIANKQPTATIDIRLVKKKMGGYYLTIKNDGLGISNYDSVDRSQKRACLQEILSSFNPEYYRQIFSYGELIGCRQIIEAFDRYNIKFEIKNAPLKGSLFEFLLPDEIEDVDA